MSTRILVGDCRVTLPTLPERSVRCCVTSPPYWGLRDYGHGEQIGLESTPDAYVEQLVAVFREVRRVLTDDGTLWLNLGDSYAGSGKGPAGNLGKKNDERNMTHTSATQNIPHGLKPKDLVGIPWRVAFALQADGWYLRSDIIWHKPNPMPESVTDRPTKSHEYVFLLSKAERYFYDAEAIQEPCLNTPEQQIAKRNKAPHKGQTDPGGMRETTGGFDKITKVYEVRNARSVWTIATQPFSGAHFAVFPEALPERCIKAGSATGDTVLDPFTGSGTTGQVAIQLGRSFVGCELNPAYADLARKRIGGAAPLFATEVA